MRYIFFIIIFLLSSLAFAQRDCFKDAYTVMGEVAQSKPLGKYPSSLLHKLEDHETFFESVKAIGPTKSFEDEVKKYKSIYGHAPTVDQLVRFYMNSSNSLSKYIRGAMGNNSELDHYLEIAARALEKDRKTIKRYEIFLKKHEEILNEPFFEFNKRHSGALFSMKIAHYIGAMGELEAALKLPDVYAQGVFFRGAKSDHMPTAELNGFLRDKLKGRFEKIGEQQLSGLHEKYPNIFKEHNMNLDSKEILRRALDFIRNKEIDIVMKRDGKYIFVEVKNFENPIGRFNLMENKSGKTIYDQQKEITQIIDFLGLSDKVIPAIYSLSGFTENAKRKLELLGMTVFGEVK